MTNSPKLSAPQQRALIWLAYHQAKHEEAHAAEPLVALYFYRQAFADVSPYQDTFIPASDASLQALWRRGLVITPGEHGQTYRLSAKGWQVANDLDVAGFGREYEAIRAADEAANALRRSIIEQYTAMLDREDVPEVRVGDFAWYYQARANYFDKQLVLVVQTGEESTQYGDRLVKAQTVNGIVTLNVKMIVPIHAAIASATELDTPEPELWQGDTLLAYRRWNGLYAFGNAVGDVKQEYLPYVTLFLLYTQARALVERVTTIAELTDAD